ncbi:sigma-70 family RNA polymerase sigma factor [Paenibacillus turicensis]|uniref:sigma-70 family RNA polymerase sigma factor n=1 Tax=Paenibacillus turicensis TaxID=160487 RepID=UPI003D2C6EA1
MTPSQLTLAAQKGDAEAFTALMEMHQSRLYRIAYAYLHNQEDALEVIQESTYRAYRNLKKLKEPSYFGTWMIRILLNCCADERKRQSRFRPITNVHTGTSIQEPSSWDCPQDPDLATAVADLEPHYRQIIILSYFEGFSLTEVADILEIPSGTVKSRLHRALGKLRDQLEPKGVN